MYRPFDDTKKNKCLEIIKTHRRAKHSVVPATIKTLFRKHMHGNLQSVAWKSGWRRHKFPFRRTSNGILIKEDTGME